MIKKITASALALLFATGVASAKTHTVKKGETLWIISDTYKVAIGDLESANSHIKDLNLIYPGDTLYIPISEAEAKTYEKEVIRLVNQIRSGKGLTALKEDAKLSQVASLKSQDMKKNNYFSHESPTYGSPFDMMRSFGITYKAAGENIAKGQKTPQAVVDAWMNSKGHRDNILKPTYTHIGVGYVESGNYWTQLFISK